MRAYKVTLKEQPDPYDFFSELFHEYVVLADCQLDAINKVQSAQSISGTITQVTEYNVDNDIIHVRSYRS